MALPTRTPEQRAAALDNAARARAARADVKNRLKSGSLTLEDAIAESANDDAIGKMKVSALIESLPGVGKARARLAMADIGIAESRRIRGLGRHQTDALVERFSR